MNILKIGVLALGLGLGCAGCGSNPTPTAATTDAAGNIVSEGEKIAAEVKAACAEAVPLASLAIALPVIGPYVAAGVNVGCNTADGLAKLIATPGTAAWLGKQIQILKTALGKA